MNTPGSYVGMTIDDNLEGLITTSEGMFFVERADKYDKKLSKDDFALYKQGDKKGGDSILCGVEEMLKSRLQWCGLIKQDTKLIVKWEYEKIW